MTESDRTLWVDIYCSFRAHRQAGETIQGTVNRAAAKCLGEKQLRSFDPKTCRVCQKCLSLEELTKPQRYHKRIKPKREQGPIILLNADGRTVVIDGNNRINKWERDGRAERTRPVVL